MLIFLHRSIKYGRKPLFNSCFFFSFQAQRHITDLYEDLRDGHNLISLLEVLSGETLVSFSDVWPSDIRTSAAAVVTHCPVQTIFTLLALLSCSLYLLPVYSLYPELFWMFNMGQVFVWWASSFHFCMLNVDFVSLETCFYSHSFTSLTWALVFREHTFWWCSLKTLIFIVCFHLVTSLPWLVWPLVFPLCKSCLLTFALTFPPLPLLSSLAMLLLR